MHTVLTIEHFQRTRQNKQQKLINVFLNFKMHEIPKYLCSIDMVRYTYNNIGICMQVCFSLYKVTGSFGNLVIPGPKYGQSFPVKLFIVSTRKVYCGVGYLSTLPREKKTLIKNEPYCFAILPPPSNLLWMERMKYIFMKMSTL